MKVLVKDYVLNHYRLAVRLAEKILGPVWEEGDDPEVEEFMDAVNYLHNHDKEEV